MEGKASMLLSQLIEHMQNLMAKHGDGEVWLEESDCESIPYCAEWFMFYEEANRDTPDNVYVI